MKVPPNQAVEWRRGDEPVGHQQQVRLDPERHLFAVGPFRVFKDGYDPNKGGHATGFHNSVVFAEAPDGSSVVLKITKNPHGVGDEALKAEVLHEVEALKVLGQSSRIPDFHGFGRIADGRYVVAMGRAEGRSFRSVKTDGPVDDAALLDRFLAAVESIHKRGFIHCDLHKGNVLGVRQARGKFKVQIVDVGTAVRLGEAGVYHGPRIGGDWISSSPEQMPDHKGQVRLSYASDVYFAASMIAERLIGRQPFKPDFEKGEWEPYLAESMRLRRADDVLPALPTGPLKTLVSAALCFDPAERTQTISSLRKGLAEAVKLDPLFTENATVVRVDDGLVVDRIALKKVDGARVGAKFGSAYASPDGVVIKHGFAMVYAAAASALGPPLGNEKEDGVGATQRFAHGQLRWDRAGNRITIELG